MWTKIKLVFQKIQPDLIRFLKAAAKLFIDVLLPIALEAVVRAEARGGSGEQKLDYAIGFVKTQAPKATAGAVLTAVQNAWAIKEAEGWD